MPQLPLRPNTTSELSPAALSIPAQRLQIPAWLMSFLLHFCVFTTAAIFLKQNPRGIAGIEESKEAGIVLVSSTSGKQNYLDETEAGGGIGGESSDNAAASAASAFPDSVELPKTSGPALPTERGSLGIGEMPGMLPGANSLTTGNGQGLPKGKSFGTPARTQVFGVQGEGNKFIYVFDRSASMEGAPLAAAKRELIASLKSLDKVHEFQIVFYNQEPRMMRLNPNQPPSMTFANEQGRRQAEAFIGGIVADGGTRHMEALDLALRLKPDAIFFLTDADDPQLSADELRQIKRLNHGASINAIEFGSGPPRGGQNFLKRLAQENRGNYGYVDATRL